MDMAATHLLVVKLVIAEWMAVARGWQMIQVDSWL
jgi:hypothetical protein